jgi:hypothetical protein
MCAEVAQLAGRAVEKDELARALGDQRLSAVSRRRDARAAMNIDAHVVVVGDQGLARVHAHPHANGGAVRPRMAHERVLRLGRCRDGVARIVEGDEEAIALRIHLNAPVSRERFPQKPPVVTEHVRVPVAELVEQPCRPLDVGEEEGDSAGRKLGHGPPPERRRRGALRLEGRNLLQNRRRERWGGCSASNRALRR